MIPNSKFFETEIERITDYDLQDFVRYYLDYYTPAYFWTTGASSSGKYHPAFSQGLGGLVRHEKAGCLFLEDLLRMSTWMYMPEEYKDYARAAFIFHDTRKYGDGDEIDKKAYAHHGALAEKAVISAWNEWYSGEREFPQLLGMAIRSHMGQWVTDKEEKPLTPIDRVVHLADYVASRSYIDIPEVSEDWERVAAMIVEDEDLPF